MTKQEMDTIQDMIGLYPAVSSLIIFLKKFDWNHLIMNVLLFLYLAILFYIFTDRFTRVHYNI